MKTFPNLATPLVKLDLTFEAGSYYQPQCCVAHAACQLIGEATARHDAAWMADFLDFRGIVVERSADVCTAVLSFYFLRRYAAELLPLVREMVGQPLLTDTLFQAFVSKRRSQLETYARKTSHVARNIFYESLFGPDHPLGVYARPDDADRLTPDLVTAFWRDRYQSAPYSIALSGHVDDDLIALVNDNLNENDFTTLHRLPPIPPNPILGTQFSTLASATQSTLRVGRVLPFRWDEPDPESLADSQGRPQLMLYSQFMVLSTLLGGYFGSRLMSNLREEKGYTYGVQCQTQIFRGVIVFYITADVAPEAVEDSLVQVDAEILRLQQEPVPADELRRVCTYMRGDYLRSIDGIFELAERHRQMEANGLDDRFFDHLLQTLQWITPADLQRLARQILPPAELLHVVAGPQVKS